MHLYRSVSKAELEDIRLTGLLRAGTGSMEGKWFADNMDDARRWGRMLYGETPFFVVRVEVKDVNAERFFKMDRLDGIGPARYAEIEYLKGVKVEEVSDE